MGSQNSIIFLNRCVYIRYNTPLLAMDNLGKRTTIIICIDFVCAHCSYIIQIVITWSYEQNHLFGTKNTMFSDYIEFKLKYVYSQVLKLTVNVKIASDLMNITIVFWQKCMNLRYFWITNI